MVTTETVQLDSLSAQELLELHSGVITELRKRGIVRSENNPLGDYTEWLVAHKLGLKLETYSTYGCDAISVDGFRYQIKGRRLTK